MTEKGRQIAEQAIADLRNENKQEQAKLNHDKAGVSGNKALITRISLLLIEDDIKKGKR